MPTSPNRPQPDTVAQAPLGLGEARFRTLFEHVQVGVVIADAESVYLDANETACRMLGYGRHEFIGLRASDIVTRTGAGQLDDALTEIHARADHRREWQLRRKDGSVFSADVVAAHMPDGTTLRVITDTSVLKERERELARLSNLYAALSHVSQAIVWATTRDELFNRVCHVLVEHGGFSMAWVGLPDKDGQRLAPIAECGDENQYLRAITISIASESERWGPTGAAFRLGQRYIANDVLADPISAAWRPELERRGLRAAAAFPLRTGGQICATLTVYSSHPSFFHDREVALLEEAASDLSFALDNFARNEARREAEERLCSERLFSDAMIESMPGILYLYNDRGRFLRWNRNLEIVTGYSREEVSGMHPRDFFAADEQTSIEERIREVFATGESAVEAALLAKDGTSTPFFFTGRRVQFEDQVCLVGVGVDISDRRRAEERLTESERRYRELVENANSIILRWNTDGRVMFLNEFGQQFFGYTAEEIVGRLVTDTIVPPTESGGRDLRQLMEAVLAAPEAFAQNVNENVRRNGERVWISWTNRIVRDESGRVVDFLSVGTDITNQRRAEAAIRESEAQAQAEQNKRHQAEAADRIKSAFLATMSHELRTPLNSIIGFTGIMLQGLAGPLNTEQNKQLDMVRTSARHLLALVNDVLDISKIEAGQLEVVRRCFDPQHSIDHVLTLVTPQADAKGLSLRMHTAPVLGEIVGDERRFEQILLNLLSNAIKFTDRGDVTLTADTVDDAMFAGATTGQPAIRVRVSDSGIGIKPEDLPTLFQPFRQLESGLARRHEGTGLGLAICRRLAALMGGEITAESAWGKGSVFTVVLPRQGLGSS